MLEILMIKLNHLEISSEIKKLQLMKLTNFTVNVFLQKLQRQINATVRLHCNCSTLLKQLPTEFLYATAKLF